MDLRWRSLATADWRRASVLVACLLLVVLVGVTLAQLVWLVIEGPVVATPAPVPEQATVQRPQERYTPAMASDWALFGDAAVVPLDVAGNEDAPATSLSLQLLGTFSTGDARLAGAVIAERGKDGELFRLGATVPGGAVLEKVEADKVLLRRRGQLETLAFETLAMPGGGAESVMPTIPGGLDMAAGFRNLKERLLAPVDGEEGGDDPQSRARTVLANLSNDLRSNPDGVLAELGLRALSSGQPSGYAVGEGANADTMRALGLRPGDVVLSVNGRPLGNVRNDARLVDEVKASGEARVEIRRGSQTFTVNYPL